MAERRETWLQQVPCGLAVGRTQMGSLQRQKEKCSALVSPRNVRKLDPALTASHRMHCPSLGEYEVYAMSQTRQRGVRRVRL